jgi:hypothetical protein
MHLAEALFLCFVPSVKYVYCTWEWGYWDEFDEFPILYNLVWLLFFVLGEMWIQPSLIAFSRQFLLVLIQTKVKWVSSFPWCLSVSPSVCLSITMFDLRNCSECDSFMITPLKVFWIEWGEAKRVNDSVGCVERMEGAVEKELCVMIRSWVVSLRFHNKVGF